MIVDACRDFLNEIDFQFHDQPGQAYFDVTRVTRLGDAVPGTAHPLANRRREGWDIKVMDKFTVPLYLRVVGWMATAVMMAVSIDVFATWK